MTLNKCPDMILELMNGSVTSMALVDTVPSKLQRTTCVSTHVYTSGWPFDDPLLSQILSVIRTRVPP